MFAMSRPARLQEGPTDQGANSMKVSKHTFKFNCCLRSARLSPLKINRSLSKSFLLAMPGFRGSNSTCRGGLIEGF